jgi:hypothetical protein
MNLSKSNEVTIDYTNERISKLIRSLSKKDEDSIST